MTGFHAHPESIETHAVSVEAIARDVANGASAEVTGTGQANFGVLIGHTLGYGITALSDHFATALSATSKALTATADQLRNTATTYRDADDASRVQTQASGAGL